MNTEVAGSNPVLQQPTMTNPFARELSRHVSAGAVAIEQERAIAEAQGKLVIAKRFPRNQAEAYTRVMEACSRVGLAEEATYSYKRAGKEVSGPSIRLAEELARCWGNIDYGLRELSRRNGESEMEAYAWDLETNTSTNQKFTVRHLRDKEGGATELTTERDIYEIGANMGARRLRARVLAIIPPDLVDAALAKCRETLTGGGGAPMADRVRSMVAAFNKVGVSIALIEKRLGKPITEILPEELADLRAIGKSIQDGIATAGEFFGGKPRDPNAPAPERPTRLQSVAERAEPAGESPETADASDDLI